MAVWLLAVWLLKDYTVPYSDQVPYYLSSSFKQVPRQRSSPSNKPFLPPSISVFLSLSLVQFGRFFHQQYLHLWSFGFPPQSSLHQVGRFFINWSLVWFPSSVFPSSSWEVFHQRHNLLRLIIFPTGLGCSHWSPGFPLQFLIIGLEGFLSGSHSSSLSTIPRSAELLSKERGNYNKVTFGAESSQSRSYVTTINYDFISSGLTSIMALGSSSSTPQSRRYIYLQVGRIFRWTCIRYDTRW